MRRIVLILCIFPALLILNNSINKGLNNIAETKYGCRNSTMTWIDSLQTKPSIVFIGSSTTKTGLSPTAIAESLNLPQGSVVNLSTMPNNPSLSYSIVKSNISSFANNAVIVYGIDPWILYRGYYKNFNNLISCLSPKERIILAFYQQHRPLTILNGGNVKSSIAGLAKRNKYKDIPDDFGSVLNIGVDSNTRKPVNDWFSSFAISEMFIQDITNIDEIVHKHNMKLIVYFPSYSRSFINQYSVIPQHTEVTRRLSGAVKYGVFNNNLSSYPDSCYTDMIHVNNKGGHFSSDRFTNMLWREIIHGK